MKTKLWTTLLLLFSHAVFVKVLFAQEAGSILGWGRYIEVEPEATTDIIASAGGEYHSLALCADGSTLGWGFNNYNQCTVPQSDVDYIDFAVGGYHSPA
ncbi:MAG: hypothetical protein H6678_08320 [Candidatus Delongbacteria bacterium]|nr:hypothetical protein [Candidatus Delongbacteria bacterium]